MKICMVTSEAVPFSKSGGLADVVGALSAELAAKEHDVHIILPCYGPIENLKYPAVHRTSISVSGISHVEHVDVYEAVVASVSYYFVVHPWFTERGGIYGDTSASSYPDNFTRFMLLEKAVFPIWEALDRVPDIIHCHDWTCGFLPILLEQQQSFGLYRNTISCFSIHNLAYQGEFSRMDILGADISIDDRFFQGRAENKRINMMRAAIISANIISTVSPTYAREIQTSEYGCGLEEELRSRSKDLTGILNGIDTDEWNPASDELLHVSYTANDLSGKAQAKKELQAYCNLAQDASIPLIGMISRLTSQKGFHELLEGSPCALEQMLEETPAQVVIVGTGDSWIEERLRLLGDTYPNLSVHLLFDNTLAHLVEAASDFFLMPSSYEPSGLNQLYSLRYGTIPIVRKTGGLNDSVIDIDAYPETGTGIVFEEMSGSGIISAVRRAFQLWGKGSHTMTPIITRGMSADFSWKQSAQAYITLYESHKKGR